MSMSSARADANLNATYRGSATPHILLHTGNPGAAGTANIAQLGGSGIARKPVSFAAPENHPSNVERRILSSSVVEWTGAQITAGQTVSHASIWSALTGGQCEEIFALTAAKVVGSDGVTVAVGDIEIAIGVWQKP